MRKSVSDKFSSSSSFQDTQLGVTFATGFEESSKSIKDGHHHDVPPMYQTGFLFTNQSMLAKHFASKLPVQTRRTTSVTSGLNQAQDKDLNQDKDQHLPPNQELPSPSSSSLFKWFLKFKSVENEVIPEQMNVEPVLELVDENFLPANESSNSAKSDLLSDLRTFKNSYSTNDMNRLLDMTPEKTCWRKNKKEEERKRRKKRNSYVEVNFQNSEIDTLNLRTCGLCLEELGDENFHTIWSCGCSFCRPCLSQFLTTNIRGNTNVPFLACPDLNCSKNSWKNSSSSSDPQSSIKRENVLPKNSNNVSNMSHQLSSAPSAAVAKSSSQATFSGLTRTLTSLFSNSSSSNNAEHSSSFSSSKIGYFENKFSRQEIEMLTDERTFQLYQKLRTEFEVEMDPNRTFCPTIDCGNICTICKPSNVSTMANHGNLVTSGGVVTSINHDHKSTNSSVMISSLSISSTLSSLAAASSSAVSSVLKVSNKSNNAPDETSCPTVSPSGPIAVHCNKCERSFCSICRVQPFHFDSSSKCPKSNIDDLGFMLMANNGGDAENDDDGPEIKRCPRCSVWIERDDGCAQMMCRKCRHVFCWFCLQSLEDDFLLRHFDRGPCKNKLGHSRASVIWHRTQVVGIFAGFGVLLLLASPLFLVAAPCFLCCNCCCSSCNLPRDESEEDDDEDGDERSTGSSFPGRYSDEIITKQPVQV